MPAKDDAVVSLTPDPLLFLHHFLGLYSGKERLSRDTVRDATRQEIVELRRENGELKQLVGELSLQVSRLKKTAIPTLVDGAGTAG